MPNNVDLRQCLEWHATRSDFHDLKLVDESTFTLLFENAYSLQGTPGMTNAPGKLPSLVQRVRNGRYGVRFREQHFWSGECLAGENVHETHAPRQDAAKVKLGKWL